MRRLVLVLVVVVFSRSLSAEEKYPIHGLAPRENIGGLIEIPGVPFIPVQPDAVRNAMRIQEQILGAIGFVGKGSPYGRLLGYQAVLYSSLGDFRKSEELFDQAQAILEKRGWGSVALDLGWLHNSRGLARMSHGQYADAIQSFKSAIATIPSAGTEAQESHAIATQNLATAYHLIGDHENAEVSYLQAFDEIRSMPKASKSASQSVRVNLALLHASIGSYEEARKLLEELAVEDLPAGLRFNVLNDLGHVLTELKDYKGSQVRLMEARERSRPGTRMQMLALSNLSTNYLQAKEFEPARRIGESALRLADELGGVDSTESAALTGSLGAIAFAQGDLQKADTLLTESRKILLPKSGMRDVLADVTRGLAMVAQLRGDRKRAVDLSHEALALDKENFERILAFGSEAQRLAYRLRESPYDQLANLGDATLLAESVLAMKGAVLESLLTERALVRKSKSPEDQKRLDEIHSLKVTLMEKTARGEGDLGQLERKLKERETALAKRLALPARERRAEMDLPHVRAKLGAGEVLIELIKFQHYEGNGWLEPWYGGVILAGAGEPVWVPLGPAEPTDQLIETLIGDINPGGRARAAEPSDAPSGSVVTNLRALEDRLWTPLERALPKGTQRVLLSPDGATHFVPWAVLLDKDDRFLVERWQLSEIGSGRDLLRASVGRSDKTVLALADGRNDLQGSRKEVTRLAKRATEKGWQATVLMGEEGSETALVRNGHPRILHFATHGGELKADHERAIQDRLSRNPMYRGFLLLGGAERTFEAWKQNVPVAFSEDGILTAEEAAGLDLDNTWLTVLSACRTGSGDARIGEGVLGLRRGFTLAGTENLLFSLWSVDDESTAQFMDAFYECLFRTGDVSEAFTKTQREELQLWKKADGTEGAVFRAGAFVLTQ